MNKRSIKAVQRVMMQNAILRLTACACLLGLTVSCTTTYDAYGRPQQSVDPAVAVAGMVAAGAIGYAIANNNNYGHYNNRYRRSSYGRGYRGGYGGGYGRGGYCRY